jgi:predicted phosphodiesterase
MKYAIISDLHSNFEALTAVLNKIDEIKVDKILCLGDLVGYHANPNECVEVIRNRKIETIAGNHDRAAIKAMEPVDFTPGARKAIYWTRQKLTPETIDFIAKLPASLTIGQRLMLTHGAVHPVPNENVRLNSDAAVAQSFDALQRNFNSVSVCFYGHTHIPVAFEMKNGEISKLTEKIVRLNSDSLYLINPGSVAQPRDGDPRSSFIVYDVENSTVQFYRVAYDRETCLKKTGQAGLIYRPPLLKRMTNWTTDSIGFVYRYLKIRFVRWMG